MVDRTDPRWEHGFHRLRVKRVVQETPDTRSFVLDVPDELRALFGYRAGQFCTFRVHIDGTEQSRCYSMSSAPETDADLTVTVKRVPGGLVSNWFHDHVTEGDTLEVTKPAGVFCLGQRPGPVVAFVGGSGVTPVMSITKSLLAGTARSVQDPLRQHRPPGHHLRRGAGRARGPLRRPAGGAPASRRDGGYLDAAAVADFAADRSRRRLLHLRPGPVHGPGRDHPARCRRGPRATSSSSASSPPHRRPRPDVAPAVVTDGGVPETVVIILKGATTPGSPTRRATRCSRRPAAAA